MPLKAGAARQSLLLRIASKRELPVHVTVPAGQRTESMRSRHGDERGENEPLAGVWPSHTRRRYACEATMKATRRTSTARMMAVAHEGRERKQTQNRLPCDAKIATTRALL